MKDNNPLVSVIVPTKNSEEFIEACLKSIKEQTYKNIELIVVDNHSTDNTISIAKKYTDKVFKKGPERSAQRNYGALISRGLYLIFIDSDMEVTKGVIRSCLSTIQKQKKIGAIIIPEESFGDGFWAQCKRLERSFYLGNDAIEAPRFIEKKLFTSITGYDESLIAGEDWDLAIRLKESAKISRIKERILHNEGKLKLGRTLQKKYYYAKQAKAYLKRIGLIQN